MLIQKKEGRIEGVSQSGHASESPGVVSRVKCYTRGKKRKKAESGCSLGPLIAEC